MTMDLYTSVMPKLLSNEIDKLDNELEKLSESGEEIIDSRNKQEKKNSIITFPGDSLVLFQILPLQPIIIIVKLYHNKWR